MKITKQEVKVFEVKAFCDCGGQFIFTNQYLSVIDEYGHRCNQCDKWKTFDKSYPRIETEEIKVGG